MHVRVAERKSAYGASVYMRTITTLSLTIRVEEGYGHFNTDIHLFLSA